MSEFFVDFSDSGAGQQFAVPTGVDALDGLRLPLPGSTAQMDPLGWRISYSSGRSQAGTISALLQTQVVVDSDGPITAGNFADIGLFPSQYSEENSSTRFVDPGGAEALSSSLFVVTENIDRRGALSVCATPVAYRSPRESELPANPTRLIRNEIILTGGQRLSGVGGGSQGGAAGGGRSVTAQDLVSGDVPAENVHWGSHGGYIDLTGNGYEFLGGSHGGIAIFGGAPAVIQSDNKAGS